MSNYHSLDSICTTYRHDFGLLPENEKNKVREQLDGIYRHHIAKLESDLSDKDAVNKYLHEQLVLSGTCINNLLQLRKNAKLSHTPETHTPQSPS